MKILEQFEELVERKPSEISYAWKGSLIITYFLGTISSYMCTILFYVLWEDVSGGHCLFWADVQAKPLFYSSTTVYPGVNETNAHNWTKDIIILYHSQKHCNWFSFNCMLACLFAITTLMMFCICGKGGGDSSLFTAPWRIVMPSLIVSLFMVFATTSTVHDFSANSIELNKRLFHLAQQITKEKRNPFQYTYHCEAFQGFTSIYNAYKYNSCKIFTAMQICCWIMVWSWVIGFLILCFRVLTTADFILMKVKIYEMPTNDLHRLVLYEHIKDGRKSELQNNEDITKEKTL